MSDPTTHDNAPAIALEHAGKTYRIYSHPSDRLKQSLMGGRKLYFREHVALHPLSLTIAPGQTVGVIGVNGSGKSTLLQLITRTLTPTTGSIAVRGRVSALLELGAGFNPEFSGHENIYLNGSIVGLSRSEIDEKYDDIVAFSGLEPQLLQQAVNTYSSGMYVRLAFAVAIAVEPDILIVDEALAVGDEGFQRKCFTRIKALQESGATILFVSHSARTITDLCDHALLLDAGELLLQGNPTHVVAQYHKMLFARDDERSTIRNAIKREQSGDTSAPQHEDITTTSTSAPESCVVYPSDGGTISNVALLDAQETSTQLLHYGQDYQLRFTFTCNADVSNLRFSMMIKTMTGVELTGIIYHDESCDTMQAGNVSVISFALPCKLAKGDYFINVGAVEETHGHYRFIHRIVDALHIKVMADELPEHNEPRGFIDMGITGGIQRADT